MIEVNGLGTVIRAVFQSPIKPHLNLQLSSWIIQEQETHIRGVTSIAKTRIGTLG
jgi:hypothetical protein